MVELFVVGNCGVAGYELPSSYKFWPSPHEAWAYDSTRVALYIKTDSVDIDTNPWNPKPDDQHNPNAGEEIKNVLKEGDYVYYRNSNNTLLKCAVLYGPENENYAKYGLQVISVEAIEQITMGEDEGPLDYITTNESTRAYDAAIQTLNSAVNKHLNTAYATGVRCVGSSPDDPFGENCVPDDKQLKALGLNNISCVYASRYIETTSPGVAPTEEWWNGHNYGLNSPNGRVFLYGELRYSYVNKQEFFSSKITCPVVPVFTLRPELKIKYGEGTSENPYMIDF